MSDLVKSITVLDLRTRAEKCVIFSSDQDEDYTSAIHDIDIDIQTWEDLGKPGQITVSVQAGDKLNEVESALFLRGYERV